MFLKDCLCYPIGWTEDTVLELDSADCHPECPYQYDGIVYYQVTTVILPQLILAYMMLLLAVPLNSGDVSKS